MLRMNSDEYLLDTHTWLWFVAGDITLKPKVRKTIDQAIFERKAHLASISFWEVSMLSVKKRVTLGCPTLEWVRKASDKLKIVNLSADISVDSCELPGEFHGDPADRIIVASSRIENLTLLTRDNNIIDYSKKRHLRALKI